MGNGQTKESALVITGKSKHEEEEQAVQVSKKSRQELISQSARRNAAMGHEFYGKDGIYSPVQEIIHSINFNKGEYKRLLTENVAKHVGTVYFTDDTKVARGMATVVRPEGRCVTAIGCVTDGDGKLKDTLLVSFPRIGVSYECEVEDTRQGLVVLKPKSGQPLKFSTCMGLSTSQIDRGVFVRTYAKSPPDTVIKGLVVERVNAGSFVFVPQTAVEELGTPIFDFRGCLLGVTVNLLHLGKGRAKLCSLEGVPLKHQNARSFTTLKNELNKMNWESSLQGLNEGLKTQMMVEYITYNRHFVDPVDEWFKSHPTEEFQ